ncbi:glycosyltransferase family 9 protein [Leucobacter ruminantium]|uniref:Glycosyltransferase family 9 protein n=1 Tax=Leucobacter ruminantium TaxID=1289170 RepID=A0A939RX40_9MICO|nr:glycosyltransferase family 9 protein [Leucobacter ruminantium]MBO1804308.1 glycosyltransferase family 9 protein [Leucobacter ruminantium]
MTDAEQFEERARALAIGPLGNRLEDVRRIAVVRGGGIGDVLFALPAIRALASAYPGAEVVLLGTPVAVELFEGRLGAPHRALVLPPARGVGAPDTARDTAPDTAAETERFLAARRDEGYDLALQMHGGGRFSNPFVLGLGARCTAGTRTPDAEPLDRNLEYVYFQHEIARWLEVAGLAGAPPVELEPRLRATPGELGFACERFGEGPLVAVHPGATDPRRRWPAERFAAVASALADEGARVVIVGSSAERELCAQVADAAALGSESPSRVIDTAGALSISELVGTLARADLMIGNDSGPRHLAQALGTTTASVYWCGNLLNAGPFGRSRHRARVSWTMRCPVCGRGIVDDGGAEERCAHDVSFVGDVPVETVLADARALLGATA